MCLSLLHPPYSLLMLQQQAEQVSSFPRHSARYKADPLPAASASSHPFWASSPSPTKNAPNSRHPPAPKGRDTKAMKQPRSACSVCLGRFAHLISKCESNELWDGSETHCRRAADGRLVSKKGVTLCSDWQRPQGCKSTGHTLHHLCSGCGSSDHGAQECPRAEKA